MSKRFSRRAGFTPSVTCVFALALATCGATACGSNDASDPVGGGSDDGPLYAMTVFVTINDAGDATSYLVTAPSLEAGVEVSPRDGIEGTMGDVVGIDGEPAVWAAGSDPTMERWSLSRDSALAFDDRLSFANLGFDYVDTWTGAFVSPELYVVFNGNVGELVRWNPTTMELGGTLALDLPGSMDQGYPPIWYTVVRPDGTIVTSWAQGTYVDEEEVVAPVSGIVAFDAGATEVIGRDEWQVPDRSVVFARGGMLEDGTIYAGPSQATVLDEDGASVPTGPVVVNRVLPDATAFDRDWEVDLSALTGLGIEWWGRDRNFFVRGDQLFFSMHLGDRDTGEVSETKWFVADAELSVAREVPIGDFIGSGSEYLIAIDDRLFIPDWANGVTDDPDFDGDTPFYEITDDGLVPAFTITGAGVVNDVVRIR